jgi:glycosyltransferase involved in cell wall biosynthesis
MKLSIIMPVYNEIHRVERAIRAVLEALLELPKELVIVEDRSTDGTREFLKNYVLCNGSVGGEKAIDLYFYNENMGKGAAISTAIPRCTGDIMIIQDADLEYDPRDYSALVQPICDDRADVVFGNRFHGEAHRVLYFWHYVGNRLLTTFSNMLTNLNLSDMEVGYKAFRAEVFRRLRVESKRFGFEPEVTMKVAKLGYRIYEVPISYHGRTYAEGKKIGWRDGVAALYHMIRYRFSVEK